MDLMKEFPDNHFELAIVDPPYGIGENKGQWKSRNKNRIDKRSGKPIIINHLGYKKMDWDNSTPDTEYFNELFRVSKNQIICGGNYFVEYLKNTPCFIVWDKFNGGSDFADCELLWTSFKSAVRKFTFMWSGFCQGKSIFDGETNQGDKRKCQKRIHPTQKPIQLYQWLLKNYAKPGDKILDTHCGSGSIAIACHYLGFDLTACELDKDYYEASLKRIKEETSQLSFF
jgi:site-specific DNA-methyltransferase (adenine-specific)